MIRLLAALVLLLCPSPAYAGPLAALIPIVVGALVKTAIVKIALTIALTVAVSALTKATQKKALPPGIQTERKLYGGTNSRTVLLGLYATAGSEVTPPMSFGNVKKTPNAYLTVVIALADAPIDGFSRLIVNGEYVPVNTSTQSEFGYPIGGKYSGKGWLKFYDGRQTTADTYLVNRYSSYRRPWTSSEVGRGVSYAILTWLYDAELFKGEPEVKFELRGMRLYDVRKDSTAGGAGSHRWDNPATWEMTYNPIVMVYNVLRGIEFVGGTKYGGECQASDLPVANWAAAMNVCDESVQTSTGTEPRYRAGLEIMVAELEPADAIEELLKACSGEIVETGGIYKVRCGPPALPVMYITDGDFLVNEASDYDPFPGINNAHNTIYATYPSPEENWTQHDAPVQTDPAYVERDQGVILSGSLTLPAVPYPLQVQRLMKGWLQDDQRWRQHSATLGHYGFVLEPLDVIAWTSEHNQYDEKLFEIDSCSENLATLRNTIALREVDPSDYDYIVTDELPDPVVPGGWDLPPSQTVSGFSVQPASVKDAEGNDRRPAILALWDADAADDADFVKIQARLFGTTVISIDVTAIITDGQRLISEGVLPAQTYEVRAKFIANRPTEWTDWLQVSTLEIKLGDDDVNVDIELDEDIQAALERIEQAQQDIEAAQQEITELQNAAAGYASNFQQLGQDIIALGGDVDTLSSSVTSQGATISTLGTTVSNQAGQLSTLNTRVAASGTNLIANSRFIDGFEKWTVSGGWFTLGPGSSNSVEFYAQVSVGPASLSSARFRADSNQIFTISANMYFAGTGGFYLFIRWYDQNDVSVGVSPIVLKTQGQGWAADLNGRTRGSVTAPPGSFWGRLVIYAESLSSGAICAITEIKAERGATMSPYTEEASVAQQYTAITTLDGQYASLNTTVQTQGASITQNATAISNLTGQYSTLVTRVDSNEGSVYQQAQAITTLDSSFASLSSTVSSQGGQITQNAQSITNLSGTVSSLSSTVSTQGGLITQNATAVTNLSGTVSSLSSTVSTQGASITQNATAISTLTGNVTTLFAQYVLEIDVGGVATGFKLANNGARTNMRFKADAITFEASTSGARTEYSDQNWRVYDDSGQMIVRFGKWA